MSELEEIIYKALRGAARRLPAHSFGLRSHALPTDTQLAACVRACARLVESSDLRRGEVFIGSSQPGVSSVPGVKVLPPETAAEAATARRNERSPSGESPTLVYLNSRSTGGESGLEVLEDLSAADLARGFAAEAGLPILQRIAESRSRRVVGRLEDASVDLLADYQRHVRSSGSEAFALPLLGLLPRASTKNIPPGAVAADEFDRLKGSRPENKLKSARDRLKSLSAEQRKQLGPMLRPYLLDNVPDPCAMVTRLCEGLHRLSSGRSRPDENICGVTVELARLLRKGAEGLDTLLGPDPIAEADEPSPAEPGEARSPWDLLEESGPSALDGLVTAEDSELDGGGLPTFALEVGPDAIPLKPESAPGLLLALLDTPGLAAYVDLGCAALVEARVGVARDLFTARTASGAVITWCDQLGADHVAQLSDCQAEIDRFWDARELLCDAVLAELSTSESQAATTKDGGGEIVSDQRDLGRLLSLLDGYAIVVARRWRKEVDAYVAAYIALLDAALPTSQGTTENKFGKWLANLDIAFSTDAEGERVNAARLLPLHPLRLASAVCALSCGAPPPPFPARLGVNYRQHDYLEASGTPNVYGVVNALSPDGLAVAIAAQEGIEATWHLVRPTGLVTALRVAFVDVDGNAMLTALEDLCASVRSVFEEDYGVQSGVHLDVWRGTTARSGRAISEIEAALPPLGPLATECAAIPRGEGVSLELHSALVSAETMAACHLVVRAVKTPYESMAAMPSGPPQLQLHYQPGASGNIAWVELANEPSLKRYEQLLEAWGVKARRRGPNPSYPTAGAPHALVDARVALGGWPVEPQAASTLLSYREFRGHVVAVLCDSTVTERTLTRRLRKIAPGVSPDLVALRRAALGMFTSRSFLQRLLEEGYDDRQLLGQLGLLRAFLEVVGEDSPTLPLSLDSPEGRAWVSAVSPAASPQRRADLLLLEASPTAAASERPRDVVKLRVVELKARSAPSADSGWCVLAAQALQTLASVQRCFGPASDASHRAALQRLAWMEAGRQHLASKWEPALRALETSMADGPAPVFSVECWVVLSQPWALEDDFERECAALDEAGEPAAGQPPVKVRFRVLAPKLDAQQPVPPAPSSTSSSVVGGSAAASSAELGGGQGAAAVAVASAVQASAEPVPPKASAPVAPARSPAVHSVPGAAPTAQRPDGMRLSLGVSARGGGPVVWMPNRTDLVNHFNVGITGTMGTGKTQLTKSLLAQLVWEGRHNPGGRGPGLLVFDYKGDYQDSATEPFASRVGATVLQPEGLPLNPLKTIRPTSRQEFVALARTFADTMLAIQPRIGAVQRMELVTAVTECFEAAGLSASDPSSWDRPFPTLRDLHAHLDAQGRGQGTPQAVLMDMVDMGIFADEDPATELDTFFDGVHVINLKPLGSMPTLIRAVLCFFMNAFYGRMLRAGEAALVQPEGSTHHLRALRRLVLVDEADDFMSLGLHSLKNVMQQGRSFGCGVVLSTQFLHHFNRGEDPLRPLIGTWLLHQMSDLNPPDVRALFGVSKPEGDLLVARLSSLPKHTSLCVGLSSDSGLVRSAIPLEVRDLPFKELRGPDGQGG
jgi:hypothetical protein